MAGGAMRADSVEPAMLDASEIAAWKSILDADPTLSSPYLTPEWAQVVGQRRKDARVVVFRDVDGPIGFLPVQGAGKSTAMPLGGPICDYQAIICRPGVQLDVSLALRALNVARIDYTGLIADHPVSAPYVRTFEEGHVVRFEKGWDAYVDERRNAGSQVIKRTRKKQKKFERDVPGVSFEAFSNDTAAFQQLLKWKTEQYHRTGATDVLSRSWIHEVVTDIQENTSSQFGGELFVLRADGDLAAVLFCLRAQDTLHAWFVGHNDRFQDYSPGLLLFVKTVEAAAKSGFKELDLGAGDYRFKQSLANFTRRVGPGYAGAANLSSVWRATQFGIRSTAEALPIGRLSSWPGKVMRRLDVWRGMANQS